MANDAVITILTKNGAQGDPGGALLSKRISLGPDGHPVSDATACAMSQGTAITVPAPDAATLAQLIDTLPRSQARAPTRYVEVATTVVAHGWAPVPLNVTSKVPNRKGWPHRILMSPERLRQEVLRELSWRDEFDRRDCACGIVVPANVLFVDVDLLDEADNQKVRRILNQTLVVADRDRRMARIGRWPKFLMGFGVAPGTVLSKKLGKVELFAGTGQVVAYGLHEMTRRPYEWGPRSPLNTRPTELAQVTAGQVEAFIDALVAANVLQRAASASSQRGNGHAGGRPAFASSGRYAATGRLHELMAECDGRVGPAIERLIREVGEQGHDRHNSIVALCGVLVKKCWLNTQIKNFLIPRVNAAFADGDWSDEIQRAIAHARDRARLRRLAMEGATAATAATTRGAV
jgi:hypothetical protein